MNTYSAATVTLMERVSQPTEPTADQQYDRAFASLKRTVLAIAAERDHFEAALKAERDRYEAALREAIEAAVQSERAEIASLFRDEALFHEECAEESARNDERDDEDAHKLEAGAWRDAAAMVAARNDPPAPRSEPVAEDIEDEIAF